MTNIAPPNIDYNITVTNLEVYRIKADLSTFRAVQEFQHDKLSSQINFILDKLTDITERLEKLEAKND